ncbi:hypothetical protein RB201_26545 [Streptomyces sp. S1A(2023)]
MDRCVPACGNIARTDRHAAQLTAQADDLAEQATSELIPGPLADRLHQRAESLRSLAAQHHRTRITDQQETTA